MGVWGSSLYANDCSCDARDTYTQFLQKQFSDEDAYKKTYEKLKEYIDTDEEPFFWYALADTQWKLGRLTTGVRENALKWIDAEGGLSFWEESKNKGTGWKKTLNKLKNQLYSEMPVRKDINPEVQIINNPWNIGDIYAYQMHYKSANKYDLFGKYIVFQKLSDEDWFNNQLISRVQVFDKIFNEIPTLVDLDNVRILPLSDPRLFVSENRDKVFPPYLNVVIDVYKKVHYPKKYLTFLGNRPDKFNMPFAHVNDSYCEWYNIDDFLGYFYQLWQEYDYEICDDKITVLKR